MDLRASIHDFVIRAKDLGLQLRSDEATMLRRAELHILEVQLYLLEKEVQRCKRVNRTELSKSLTPSPHFPPFFSTDDALGQEQKPE